jgi:hypothetical protein
MKLFLDCEFTQLNKDTKLISLALVSEVGHEFYVELTDTYQVADCSDLVIQNVLPHSACLHMDKPCPKLRHHCSLSWVTLKARSIFARTLRTGTGISSAN